MMKTFWIATAALLASSCHGLSTTTTTATNNHPTVSLQTLKESQLAILDGAEWTSVQMMLKEQGALQKATIYGYCKVVTGRNAQNDRVVALQADNDSSSTADNVVVFESSIANIPDKVSDPDAMSTYIISLSAIHCALPKVENVGGGGESLIAGKAVVLGGNELACFAAQGLASFGVQVSLVSTNSPKINNNSPTGGGTINILKPGVGNDKAGFASVIGEFDSLLDTAYDERGDKKFEPEETTLLYGGTVLDLLKSRHNCNRYISTMTSSQRIVRQNGVMFGPGKADEYAKKLEAPSFLSSPDVQPMPPLADLGRTVQSLLDNGIVFTEQQRKKMYSKSNVVKGWSLADFWEQATWPRDSNGGANTRFGLPTKEDPDLEDEDLLLEAPLRRIDNRKYVPDVVEEDPVPGKAPVQKNPYVQDVIGVRALQEDVMDQKKDCLIFLSAKFCKTCKTLNPQYTRMARLAKEDSESPNSSITFVKAEASGPMGKPLGKFLEIEAVPSFILYRQGERFGVPLSASRLPSDKINRALELLVSGQDWDESILEEEF